VGALIGVDVLPENYDSFNVGFSNFISVDAQDKVCRKWATNVWNDMMLSHPIQERIKFEGFGRATITTLTRLQLTLTSKWPKRPDLGEVEFTMPCCREMTRVNDPLAAVTGSHAKPLVLYYTRQQNCRLIDGAYRDEKDHVYLLLFSVQKPHFIDENHIAQLKTRIGEHPTLVATLCVVVPDYIYSSFETTPLVIESCPCEIVHVRLPNPKHELYWPVAIL
jgi:hypothetical protein